MEAGAGETRSRLGSGPSCIDGEWLEPALVMAFVFWFKVDANV